LNRIEGNRKETKLIAISRIIIDVNRSFPKGQNVICTVMKAYQKTGRIEEG
jgi:hypothetical protein